MLRNMSNASGSISMNLAPINSHFYDPPSGGSGDYSGRGQNSTRDSTGSNSNGGRSKPNKHDPRFMRVNTAAVNKMMNDNEDDDDA